MSRIGKKPVSVPGNVTAAVNGQEVKIKGPKGELKHVLVDDIIAKLDKGSDLDADEIFLTSTSLCICPVTRVNGMEIGPKGQVWGPVTTRITEAYKRFVDHDFVGQYLKRYTAGMAARAF